MKKAKTTKPVSPDTLCVHAGGESVEPSRPLTAPVYLTSTFRLKGGTEKEHYYYTRYGNPTRTALEETLAALEGGASAVACAAGMAAETTLLHLFETGTHVVSARDIYGGTHRLFTKHMTPMGFSFTFVDASDPKNFEAAATSATKLFWIETPGNPLVSLTDIAGVAKIAHKRGITVVVDGTFASPLFQQPLALGADIVVHSTTKYLNGHSDVVGGAVIAKSRETGEKLAEIAGSLGLTCSPFDAWLVMRGLRTLGVRMKAHEANATALATFLETRSEVERVYYPGLASHPQHELAKRQMTGFGGMVAFDVKGGTDAVLQVFSRLKLFTSAPSLGGVESLVQHPATMSHASMTPAERAAAGISDGCIRVSVGIENADDLIRDMADALDGLKK